MQNMFPKLEGVRVNSLQSFPEDGSDVRTQERKTQECRKRGKTIDLCTPLNLGEAYFRQNTIHIRIDESALALVDLSLGCSPTDACGSKTNIHVINTAITAIIMTHLSSIAVDFAIFLVSHVCL